MKIISRSIDKDGMGKVVLTPEHDEDMYHLYNLLQPGDRVRAPAVRRVQNESSTGSVQSHRVKLHLTIEVVRTSFDTSSSNAPADPAAATASGSAGPEAGDAGESSMGMGGPAADGAGPTLHIAGKVVEENNYVRMGAFHTIDVEKNRTLTVTKEGPWDAVHLERLEESADASHSAEVGAVVMGEGTAVVCLLTEHMTVIRQRIDVPVPRKHKGLPQSAATRAVSRFHSLVYAAVLRLLQLPALRLIILASPGFTRDAVQDFIFAEGIRQGEKLLVGGEARRKFIKIHCSSPHIHSLMEVLRSPEISAQLKDTKFAREGQLLARFLRMLSTDELRAWYSEAHVLAAAARGAVGALLISDGLFRAADPVRRKRFVDLVDEVRKQGGEVAIFSSMHESGRQLNGLTGIAAILTYPLDVEIVEEEEREARGEIATAASEELQPNPNRGS